MSEIKETKRLLVEIFICNLFAKHGVAITPLLSGPHGTGKSQICNEASKILGGKTLTIEGGLLSEGELGGLPFAYKREDGSTEVRFTPYYLIKNIQELEKKYYEQAKTTGFLDGTVKLEKDNSTTYEVNKEKEKILPESVSLDILDGDINKYQFGKQLPPEIKIKLLESHEIIPVFLFIDELNRTEMQTMKELMNIVLNRNINGYDLPWWVMVVSAINPCSQNSTYATNEMDDAQLDRFLKIKVDNKFSEWVDYALDSHLNDDLISSLAATEEIFKEKDSSHNDNDDMKPSPRSWEMVSVIMNAFEKIKECSLLNPEDLKYIKDDLRTLINGKVGPSAGRALFTALENKENNIMPEEIINGESSDISKQVVGKFNSQKTLHKKITADRVIRYIQEEKMSFEKVSKSAKPEDKKKWANIMSQLKQFVSLLDNATQLAFVKKIIKDDQEQEDRNKKIYNLVSKAFSSDVLSQLIEFKNSLNKLDNNN